MRGLGAIGSAWGEVDGDGEAGAKRRYMAPRRQTNRERENAMDGFKSTRSDGAKKYPRRNRSGPL
jgi:hypothetical protein